MISNGTSRDAKAESAKVDKGVKIPRIGFLNYFIF
jgi:hypothetical protein